MTIRLYLNDPYLKSFTARIVETTQVGDHPAVIMDQTALYPGGGGQPVDFGCINDCSVVGMQVDVTNKIIHLLDKPIGDEFAKCSVNWPRRFDHMQHHTGQHILSKAFVEVCRSPTVSFHLGEEYCTIDIDASSLSDEKINEVESLANSVVLSNQYVFTSYYSREQASIMNLRRLPELDTDKIRLVEIGDFDLTACGGTHVSHTGEVGPIKITSTERIGPNMRVSFLCGFRALEDYATRSGILDRLALEFTTGHQELEPNILRLRSDFKHNQQALRKLRDRLLDFEAAELLSSALRKPEYALVKVVFDERDSGEIRLLANKVVNAEPAVALLATSRPKLQMVFARSESLQQDMNLLLKEALKEFESASGGGRASFAQGGGDRVPVKAITRTIDKVSSSL